jgi:hypothetical protein
MSAPFALIADEFDCSHFANLLTRCLPRGNILRGGGVVKGVSEWLRATNPSTCVPARASVNECESRARKIRLFVGDSLTRFLD